MMSIDPIALAQQLITCPSVTPARGEVFDVLEDALKPLGFDVHRWVMGEAPDGPTENMVAIRGDGRPAFRLRRPPRRRPAGRRLERAIRSTREIEDGLLVGRGANDMKSAIAAFVAAISRIEQHGRHAVAADHRRRGRLCHLRHAADHRLAERAADPPRHDPDRRADLGRPARRHGQDRPPRLGQHVDRRARACRAMSPTRTAPTNPIPPLARVIAALDALHLDDGTEHFPPSNLEFTAISTPTNASNVIPGSATAQLNIRFNNLQRGADLVKLVEEIAEREAPGVDGPRAHLGRSVPDPAGPALRRGGRGDRGGDRRRSPSCRPAAARRTAASSSSSARWSISACPTRPCTRSANARRSRTSAPCRGSTSGSCGRCSA